MTKAVRCDRMPVAGGVSGSSKSARGCPRRAFAHYGRYLRVFTRSAAGCFVNRWYCSHGDRRWARVRADVLFVTLLRPGASDSQARCPASSPAIRRQYRSTGSDLFPGAFRNETLAQKVVAGVAAARLRPFRGQGSSGSASMETDPHRLTDSPLKQKARPEMRAGR